MEKKYFVNPMEFAAAISTVIAAVTMAFCLLTIRRPVSALIFLFIALLFLKVSVTAGAKITVNPKGITRSVPGKAKRTWTWEEISEIGVAGSRIFHKGSKEKTGTLYIYFSKIPMTEQEQFQMMLKWPPKDKLYLQYDKYRMDFIQELYGKKIKTYNTGSLKV